MTYYDYLYTMSEIESFPVAGTNEYGEHVIIDRYDGDNPYFKVTTYQHNNWIRINYVYKDGTVEEIYER